jgi:hypothetical protein
MFESAPIVTCNPEQAAWYYSPLRGSRGCRPRRHPVDEAGEELTQLLCDALVHTEPAWRSADERYSAAAKDASRIGGRSRQPVKRE